MALAIACIAFSVEDVFELIVLMILRHARRRARRGPRVCGAFKWADAAIEACVSWLLAPRVVLPKICTLSIEMEELNIMHEGG